MANSGVLAFANPSAQTFPGQISGSGSVTKSGWATLVLSGSSSYSGSTLVNAGVLQIGNGGSGASIGGTSGVTDNASLVFNHGDSVTFSPVITGSGSLTQTGSGVLILTNVNAYTGATTIAPGRCRSATAAAAAGLDRRHFGRDG